MSTPLSASLCRHLLDGVSRGLQASGQPTLPQEAVDACMALMIQAPAEGELVAALDHLLGQHPGLQAVGEYLFDLAIMQVISQGTDAKGENYFDAPEWMALEEQTLDRGTELLNVLVYLRDCVLHEVQPSMRDFLNEFLLVEEDDFQDEFYIYEPFIRNQELAEEGSVEEIAALGAEMDEPEMQELFAPVMWFFASVKEKGQGPMDQLLKVSTMKDVHGGLFQMMRHYEDVDAGDEN